MRPTLLFLFLSQFLFCSFALSKDSWEMKFVNLNPVPKSQTVHYAALITYVADDGRQYPKGVFTSFADLETYLAAFGRGTHRIYWYAGCMDPTQVSIGDQTVSIEEFREMFKKAGVQLAIGVGF